MKIAIAFFLMVSSAFAADCPDISGQYLCKSSTVLSHKQIAKTDYGFQVNSDGVVMNYITDGMNYEIPSTDSYKNAVVQSYCQNDQLIVNFNATIIYEGAEVAKQVSKTSYTMKDDQLIIQQKVKMKNLPMPSQFITCTRE